MEIPSDLKYTKSHEWVQLSGDVATIGITDFAQSELGDIVFVDLPKAGSTVIAAEPIGSVESVKAASDIYSPLSGEIVEVNDVLGGASELLNSAPYAEGWLFKVKISNQSEVSSLLDADAYRKVSEE